MAIDLDPPPPPGNAWESYPVQFWIVKLWQQVKARAGSITGATSGGSGVSIIDTADTTSTTLAFKSLAAGTNITLTDTADEIIISATGGGGSGGILPVVNGEVPPVLVYLPDGSLVYTEIL